MNAPPPVQKGPPMALIIGAVVIIVVIVAVVIWKLGSGGSGGGSSSQNVQNIQAWVLATAPKCQDYASKFANWADSIGCVAVPTGQACPQGTTTGSTKTTKNGSSSWSLSAEGGFQLCAPTNFGDMKKPQDVIDAMTACLKNAS